MTQEAQAQTQSTQAPATTPEPAAPIAAKPEVPKEAQIDYSARFAELTKKERAILQKQAEVKEAAKKLEEYENAKKNAKLNPKAFLEAHGLSYQELTEFLLNDEKPSPETQIKTELDYLKAQLEEERQRRESKEQEAERLAEEKVVNDFKSSLKAMADSDDFELIRSEGESGIDLVYSVMEEYFDAHGTMMDKAEAMKQVEFYLESELKRKYENAKKVKSWWAPAPETKEAGFRQTEEPLTLTNKTTLAGSIDSAPRHFDDDETSKRKAAAFLQAQLAKSR